MSEKNNLYMVKAMYLGSEPMGELLDGENGSDAIQVPLKRTILRTTETSGDEVELSMTNDSLLVTFVRSKRRLVLKVDLLAYCGALRQLPANRIKNREFETLDKSPVSNSNDPPLFVTIFRNLEMENTLFCHSFIIRKDEEAMELVKLVMEIYYNLIRTQELEYETSLNDQDDNFSSLKNSTNKLNMDALNISKNTPIETNLKPVQSTESNREVDKSYSSSEDTYNYDSNKSRGIVSATGVLNNDYLDQLTKSGISLVADDEEHSKIKADKINLDPEPIVIKRKNEDNIEYKQNVFIRWLQPPTPPPPAPIIIREVQEEEPEQPPLIIYKQAPRPETPPPLIIRERPPSPINQSTEPFIIEKRLSAKNTQRKVIIEHLPAPPPKPRDIILEKWLPRNVPSERAVYYQKLNVNNCQYDSIDFMPSKSSSSQKCSIKQASEILANHQSNKSCNRKSKIYANSRMEEASQLNTKDIYYPSSNTSKKGQKVTGYRIIRQIIPGPNSTPAEIEKALVRSQHVSTTLNQNLSPRIYSPSFNDRVSFNHSHIYSGGSNLNIPGVYSYAGGIYSQGTNSIQQKNLAGLCNNSNKSYSSHQDIYSAKTDFYKRVNSVDKIY